MIISHRHRFIYLRTEKTGSTALESALRSILGPEDEVSGHGKYLFRYARVLPLGTLKKLAPRRFGLHPHASARDVRNVVGHRVFDNYFKFAVERNVWDRQISLYNHRKSRKGEGERDFVRDMSNPLWRKLHHTQLRNWDVYSIGNTVVADKVIQYDDLQSGIDFLTRQFGLEAPLSLSQRNAGHRTDRKHYSLWYTDPIRDLVERMYHREVEHFGFTFEDRRGAMTGLPTLPAGRVSEIAPLPDSQQGTF